MPTIVEYNAPQGIGLNPTEVGIESTAAAARRVNAAFSETAQVKEEAGRRIGAGIREAGDAASQYITHQEVSRAAASFAKFKLGEIQNWNQQSEKADPNDPTVGGKYMEGLEGRLQQFQQGFLTEGGQKWADAQVISFRDHMSKTTASDMASHAGNAAVINQRSLANTLSNTAYQSPTPDTIRDAFGTLDSTTETLIANNPNLRNSGRADDLRKLNQSIKESIVNNAVLGHIDRTGQVPDWASKPEFAPYVKQSENKTFDRYAQAVQRRQEVAQRTAADFDRKQQTAAFNTDLNQARADNLSFDDNGNATIKPEYIKTLTDLQRKYASAGINTKPIETEIKWVQAELSRSIKNVRTDTDTYRDLLDRMSDPNNPTTDEQIRQARADHKLSKEDTASAINLLNAINKEPLKDPALKGSLAAAKAVLGTDPTGKTNYNNFYRSFIPQYMEARRSGSLQPNALDLNDQSSLISQAMKTYRRSASQIMIDRATGGGQGVQTPAQPKFTPPPTWQFSPSLQQYRDPSTNDRYDLNGKKVSSIGGGEGTVRLAGGSESDTLNDDQSREQYNEDERKLRLGEDSDKEAFVKKYGLQEAIDRLDDEIERMGNVRGHGERALKKELETWRNRFRERQRRGEDLPQA